MNGRKNNLGELINTLNTAKVPADTGEPLAGEDWGGQSGVVALSRTLLARVRVALRAGLGSRTVGIWA